MKIILDFHTLYKHCYFKTCLPTHQDGFQNRDMVYNNNYNNNNYLSLMKTTLG